MISGTKLVNIRKQSQPVDYKQVAATYSKWNQNFDDNQDELDVKNQLNENDTSVDQLVREILALNTNLTADQFNDAKNAEYFQLDFTNKVIEFLDNLSYKPSNRQLSLALLCVFCEDNQIVAVMPAGCGKSRVVACIMVIKGLRSNKTNRKETVKYYYTHQELKDAEKKIYAGIS